MACRFTYNGKEYDQDGLAEALRKMPPVEAAKFIPGIQALPEMPFKQTWPDLGLKRMLHRAATETNPDGTYKYHALSWTPGEAQAARYDLSKQISRIDLHDNTSGGIGKPQMEGPFREGALTAYDHSGHKVIDGKWVTPETLPDLIGKEAADKLINATPRAAQSAGLGVRQRRLEGLDLKVGGEGMKAFYDKMLPDKLNSLVRKYGTKVGKSEIETPKPSGPLPSDYRIEQHGNEFWLYRPGNPDVPSERFPTRNAATLRLGQIGREQRAAKPDKAPVWMVPITPQLRAAASRGFPTFSSGGRVRKGTAV